MKNFSLIQSNIDVQPLLEEIQRHTNPWELHTGRQNKIKVQREASSIPLRGIVKSKIMGRKRFDVHESRYTTLSRQFPQCIAFIKDFALEIDGELSRAKLVNLPPGNRVYSHIDRGDYYKIRNRYHLVLSTGPDGSYLKAGNESVRMKTGELWWFDNKAPHESHNDSSQDRIHLIFDLLPTPEQQSNSLSAANQTVKYKRMTLQSISIWILLGLSIMLPVAANDKKNSEGHQVYEFIKQQQKMLEQQQKQNLALQQQLQEQKKLQVQLKQQQQQIETLHQLVLDQQQQIENKLTQTEHKVKILAKPRSNVKISKKGLRIQSSNGDYTFQAGGRIHADYAHYNDDETRMGNGANLRRARLYFKGKYLRDWRFKAEIEFGEDSKVGPRGVWIGYNGWKPVSFKLGNFQEPFSLEEMGGSNAISFMERSLGNSFAPSYHLGIGASTYGDFWSLSTGVFGKSVGTKDDTIDDGWGIAARATIAPILADDKLLHFGFSGEYRRTDNNNQIRLRSRPESNVTNRRLVDTRTINDVETTVLLGAEFAALYGPVSIQGEYFHNRVVRKQATNLDFNAAYLQGSWLITGESRNYQVKRGVFGLIHPLKKYGAWELGLRYSLIDLDDHDIKGGKQNNFTLGLNWYVNYNLRFMINYIFVNAHPNRNAVNESPNILQMRGQLVF